MVLMWEGKNCVEFFSFCFSFLRASKQEEAQQAAPGVWKDSSSLCEFCLPVFATAPTILKRAVFFS